MAYTIDEIKLLAYNFEEKQDFSIAERNLFLGIAYCYDWYKAHPEDKNECIKLMEFYIQWYKDQHIERG